MKLVTKVGVLGVLVVAAVAGRRAWKHLPPYELGMREEAVRAESSSSRPDALSPSDAPSRSDAPHIGNCPVLPADNIWNTPVDTLPKDSHSQAYTDSIGSHKLHPDFGSPLELGMPYTIIDPKTRPVSVTFDYTDESDHGRYPIPPDAPIEGGTTSKGDRHILLIDPRRCLLYELFDAHPLEDGSWHAGSGVKYDLTSNALRRDGNGSADGAGTAIFPGLVRYEEVEAGAINHALRFTIPHTQAAWIWPARHKASAEKDPGVPPMGARFRLRADFDISKYSATNQVILKALKRYGMILADNGGAIFISGVADKRWDDSDLHKLNGVSADDLEVVDESGLQMLPDSARVDPVALHR